MRKNKKGFTLIEIIVVVVVLAVLMAVAVPSVLKYIHEADDAKVYTVVRTYMNDIQIATAKATIDDQDKTGLTWGQFEKDIAGYLTQEGLYTFYGFGSVYQNLTGLDLRPGDTVYEGYNIWKVVFTAKDANSVVSYEIDDIASNDGNPDPIDFSKGINFTEYKFFLQHVDSGTLYRISCVPNGKITIIEKTTY